MGFKADASFLKFLTMGAVGVQQVVKQLRDLGFQPIELERYCASNKIWTTKVKRLRLPDLLCIKTGLRIEAKGKSDLTVKMSHAEHNLDRSWDAGLNPQDLIAFIKCYTEDTICAAESALFFAVGDLQANIHSAKLGPPKSASEGAERDLTWPCIVAKKDGEVLDVDPINGKIKTKPDEGRKYTYTLRGKTPYVAAGDRYKAFESILAGTLSGPVDVRQRLNDTWNPFDLLNSEIDIDRYAATKAIPFLETNPANDAVNILEGLIDNEVDERVALEMASSLTRLNSQKGFDFICHKIENPTEAYIPMEATFILTEIANNPSIQIMESLAGNHDFVGNEIRQAAVWGLGKAGAKAYNKLIQFIDEDEDEVALHAIAAFGNDTDNATIDNLIELLVSGNPRQKAAACKSLSMIQSDYVINQLKQAAENSPGQKSWIIASLGQQTPKNVRLALANSPLLEQTQPLFHMSKYENWLATTEKDTDLKFLVAQSIF